MVKLMTPFIKILKMSEDRLNVCRSCEHFEENTSRCKQCGCFMELKTRIPFVECPVGKWGKMEEEDNKDV